MFSVLSMVEKIFRGVRTVVKLAYYRLKYGDRLKLGKGVHFRKSFIINISKNGRVEIGDGTFFNNYCSINCHKEVKIGKNNLFGEGVRIYDHNHVFNDKNVNMKKTYRDSPILVGDRNWFGSNVVILSKAKVGDNNVFGANMVVNSEYGSGNLVRTVDEVKVEKIRFKKYGSV